ncbi:bifunctional protein FolD [Clostridia bacterium]|nr:bifunctional protein FolD [Clostridia bacterium]
MAYLIDGKRIAQEIKDELKDKVAALKAQGKSGTLVVIQVGSDPASSVYVRNKKAACAYIGIDSISHELPEDTTEEALLTLISELNQKPEVKGILVQLPIPKHMDENKVICAISPEKDVDGFSPKSVGALVIGQKGFVSCTPAGIIELLVRAKLPDFSIEGKHCVIVGRSNIVGKPMALLMLRENATVTIAHSKTKNLPALCTQADILIVAMGKPGFIGAEYVKEGAVVIDVGIHRKEDGKLCGDVRFREVEQKAFAITPVPGGVGPMTIAMLMKNCVESIEV